MNNLDKIMMEKAYSQEEACIGNDLLAIKGKSVYFYVYLRRHIKGAEQQTELHLHLGCLSQRLYVLAVLDTICCMLWVLYVFKIRVNVFNFVLILEFYNS